MDKEQILKMSRQENHGNPDERELYALGKASRTGLLIGTVICIALVFVSKFCNVPAVGMVGWIVVFAMHGSSNLALYKHLSENSYLRKGIVGIAAAIGFTIAFALMMVL